MRLRQWLGRLAAGRDAHNERIKLFAVTINAAGIGCLVSGVLSPLFDSTRRVSGSAASAAIAIWAVAILAAFLLLGYIKGRD